MFHLLKSIQSLLKVSSWTVLIKLQNKFMKIKMQILFLPDYISLLFSSFVKKFFETFTSTIFDSSNVNCLKVTLVLHRKHLPYLLANSIWWIKKYNFFFRLKVPGAFMSGSGTFTRTQRIFEQIIKAAENIDSKGAGTEKSICWRLLLSFTFLLITHFIKQKERRFANMKKSVTFLKWNCVY